ncbi:hypothetical protein [Streptomyces sp. BA2]|uniref:hypothetical protein n=1 Tax=Streptomyces sp. BA2 TaxID=436595 RepID=UPI00132231CD|nr:hypothetical protein [Streptomyces sp. BA2]MWA07828.1 hypothetical protein [Streptomyces sp. BA2]
MDSAKDTKAAPSASQVLVRRVWAVLIGLVGAFLLGWLSLVLVGLIPVARWWLRAPEDDPADREAVRLFRGCASLMGIPLEKPSWTVTRQADGSEQWVKKMVPTRVSEHVTLRRGRGGQIEEVTLRCADRFEAKDIGRLANQIRAVTGQLFICDRAAAYNQPVFRSVPAMATGPEIPFTGAHLEGLAWNELPLAVTDPGTPGARQLADGRWWLVIDMSSHPHLLGTGVTGVGKSAALSTFIATITLQHQSFLEHAEASGATDPVTGGVVLADGKGEGDFAHHERTRGVLTIVEEPQDIADAVDRVFREMCRRSDVRRRMRREDAAEPNFPPLYLNVDDWMNVVDGIAGSDDGMARLMTFYRQARRIAQRGRSVRVFLVVWHQCPQSSTDASDGPPGSLPPPLDRLLNVRIGLGHDGAASGTTLDSNDAGQLVDEAKDARPLPGRGVFRIGARIGRIQFPYLADPTTLPAGSDRRREIEAMLPAWAEGEGAAAWASTGQWRGPTDAVSSDLGDAELERLAAALVARRATGSGNAAPAPGGPELPRRERHGAGAPARAAARPADH